MRFISFPWTKFFAGICFTIVIQSVCTSCNQKDRYVVLVNDANGLQKGCDVIYQGALVGEVSQIKITKSLQIAVTILLDKDFSLPANSKFMVQAPLIGSTRLIVEKSGSHIPVSKGDTLLGYIDTTSTLSCLLIPQTGNPYIKSWKGLRN